MEQSIPDVYLIKQLLLSLYAEIKRLVTEGHKEATRILKEKSKEWETLAQALIEYETLTGDEIKAVIAGEKINKSSETPVSEEKRTKASVPEV